MLNEIITFTSVQAEKNAPNYINIYTNRKYSTQFWFDKNYEAISRTYVQINSKFLSEKNYWILKPTDLYQGKCIDISNDFSEISKKCKNMFRGVDKRLMPELLKEIVDDQSSDEGENEEKEGGKEGWEAGKKRGVGDNEE